MEIEGRGKASCVKESDRWGKLGRVVMEMGEDGHERARSVSCISNLLRRSLERHEYLIPTPPATKTTLWIFCTSIFEGGHTKLPPTLTSRSDPNISDSGLQSHTAGGFRGDF